jgi:predicted protein tyrosine phosphatase
VCSLARAEGLIAQRQPERVVSLLDPATPFPKARGLGEGRHLKLPLHDILEDAPGFKAPCGDRVGEMIAFVSAWGRDDPILIHCYAGISRSTATAFVTACIHNPRTDEEEIAWAIRRASPTATPNARIVALADAALGRSGRMSRAAAGIGRGFPTWPDIDEAEPFEIPARFDTTA